MASIEKTAGASSRLQRLRASFPRLRVGSYLVTHPVDIGYLTGFPSSDSWLYVSPRRCVYLTDGRYREEAERRLPGVPVRCPSRGLASGVASLAARDERIGCDRRRISWATYERLRAACPPGVSLVPADGAVEALRRVKDAGEVRKIKECISLNHRVLNYVKRILRPGLTENEVRIRILRYLLDKGAEAAFDPIVACGPDSSLPHARAGDRRIRSRDLVLVDVGVAKGGYRSDLTRMFFLGTISSSIVKAYDAVREAQRRAILKIAPGVPVSEVDGAARRALREAGLGRHFVHALGHGVGMEIHEAPRISGTSKEVLDPGMVVTVEPGVYMPGEFGVRVEDMVLVTDRGCEVLSQESGDVT